MIPRMEGENQRAILDRVVLAWGLVIESCSVCCFG